MAVNIPSINVPFTDSNGRINRIWHEFLRSFVSQSVGGTVSETVSGATITAGNGLTGGGNVLNNTTLTVGQGSGIAVNADDVAVDINNQAYAVAQTSDEVLISRTLENNSIKKTKISDIVALAPTSTFHFIESKTASTSASLDFTNLGDYSYIEFILCDLAPATDAQAIAIRTSTDGGANYDSGAGNYSYAANGETSTPASGTDGSSSATYIKCSLGVGNSTNEKGSGIIRMFNPTGTGYCMFNGQTSILDASTLTCITSFSGTRRSAAQVNAVRFMFESGNIVSGTIYAYGISKI